MEVFSNVPSEYLLLVLKFIIFGVTALSVAEYSVSSVLHYMLEVCGAGSS